MADSGRSDAGAEERVFLVCALPTRLCALELSGVVETMRPLPLLPFAQAPAFVLGISVIRGEPVPVLDAGRLAGDEPVRAARFVTLRAGERTAALAVEGVRGLCRIPAESLSSLPPLLAGDGAEAVRAFSSRDAGLLVVLDGARVVPDELWARLRETGSAA